MSNPDQPFWKVGISIGKSLLSSIFPKKLRRFFRRRYFIGLWTILYFTISIPISTISNIWTLIYWVLFFAYELTLLILSLVWLFVLLSLNALNLVTRFLYRLVNFIVYGTIAFLMTILENILFFPLLILEYTFSFIRSFAYSWFHWLCHKWDDLNADPPKKEPIEILKEMGVGRRCSFTKSKTRQKTQTRERKASTSKEPTPELDFQPPPRPKMNGNGNGNGSNNNNRQNQRLTNAIPRPHKWGKLVVTEDSFHYYSSSENQMVALGKTPERTEEVDERDVGRGVKEEMAVARDTFFESLMSNDVDEMWNGATEEEEEEEVEVLDDDDEGKETEMDESAAVEPVVCRFCGKIENPFSDPFLTCSKCLKYELKQERHMLYCSSECCKADWKLRHKAEHYTDINH